jgi:hypothetical protein
MKPSNDQAAIDTLHTPPGGRESVSIRSTILATFETVAAGHEKTLGPLTDDLILLESGLDSLCIAVIVASLEDDLGLDPFSESETVQAPVTLDDFIRLYVDASR